MPQHRPDTGKPVRIISVYDTRLKSTKTVEVRLTHRTSLALDECDQGACLEARSPRSACTCHCGGAGHGALRR